LSPGFKSDILRESSLPIWQPHSTSSHYHSDFYYKVLFVLMQAFFLFFETFFNLLGTRQSGSKNDPNCRVPKSSKSKKKARGAIPWPAVGAYLVACQLCAYTTSVALATLLKPRDLTMQTCFCPTCSWPGPHPPITALIFMVIAIFFGNVLVHAFSHEVGALLPTYLMTFQSALH
jgi:hypothetical protein